MDTERVRQEFSRQASQMADAQAFRNPTVQERLVATLKDRPASRVLDLACGPGIIAEAVAPYADEIVGVDVTPEMIRLAEQRFAAGGIANGRFLIAPAEQLPFPDGSFDRVVTRLSLHHFSDVTAVLTEVRRVLTGEGELVVADIIAAEDSDAADLHNALEQLRDPTHVEMLSKSTLCTAILKAGFGIISQETWEQERQFDEWSQIVGDPLRTDPLQKVMRSLIHHGLSAGIHLREVAGEIHFTHTWLLVRARLRPSGDTGQR